MSLLCKIIGHSYPLDSLYENHLCTRCRYDRTNGLRDRFYAAVQEWEPGDPVYLVWYQGIPLLVPQEKKPKLKLVVDNEK